MNYEDFEEGFNNLFVDEEFDTHIEDLLEYY